jgi:hypothetical protein
MQEKTKYIIWFKEIYRRGAEVINFRKFFSAAPRFKAYPNPVREKPDHRPV